MNDCLDEYYSDTESSITYSESAIKYNNHTPKTEKQYKSNDKMQYTCKTCNFITHKNSDWNRHLKTTKHKRNTGVEEKKYYCDCGNVYKHSQSLWNHRKKCTSQHKIVCPSTSVSNNSAPIHEQKSNDINSEYIMEFIKQNKELQNIIVEQNKEFKTLITEQNKEFNNKLLEIAKNQNQTITNVQNNIQNINNNIFNLNVFLNEQCKEALNMEEFLNSIELSVMDLEETGRLGFVSGISRIFIEHIKKMDIHERPLHCTDIKREIVYIKDNDSWEKEDAEKTRLINVVKTIVRKNLYQMVYWREQNPDFIHSNTKANEDYCRISLNSLGPYSEEDEKKELNKIMRNVLKEVTISKYKEEYRGIM